MIFTKITNKLNHFLREYSYFTDSIVSEIIITNSDYIRKKNGHIVVTQKGSKVEILLNQQPARKNDTVMPIVKIILHNVTGSHLLEISNFIIFEVAIKQEKNNLFFSLTGEFNEGDIYFKAKKIEFIEIEALPNKYRL